MRAYLESQNPPREEPGVQKPWPEAGRRYRFLFGSLAVVIVAGILVYAFILYDQSDRTISPAQPGGSPPAEQVIPEPAVPIEPVDPAKPTAADTAPARDKGTTPPPAPATAPGSAPVTVKPAIPPPVAASGEDAPSRYRGPGALLAPDHRRPESLLSGPSQAGGENRADGFRLISARHRQRGRSQPDLPGETPGKSGKTGAGHPPAFARKDKRRRNLPEEAIQRQKFPFDNDVPMV